MSTAGRYRNLVKLGEGTYGSVYKGTEKNTNRAVACKRMMIASEEEGVPGTAIREICILKELRHPHVVELLEVLYDKPKITLILELCDYDLKKYLESKPNGRLDGSREVQLILKQMLSGLEFMHSRGVVHRDLKPQNIFLKLPHPLPGQKGEPSAYDLSIYGNMAAPPAGQSVSPAAERGPCSSVAPCSLSINQGGGAPVPAGPVGSGLHAPPSLSAPFDVTVKLGDFGLARVEDIPVKKYSHEVVTLWYRSPDVMMGSALYSYPVDMWSMGTIFYEMVTGKVLFCGRNEEDQLLLMFSLLGSPTVETWPSMNTYPATPQRLEKMRTVGSKGGSANENKPPRDRRGTAGNSCSLASSVIGASSPSGETCNGKTEATGPASSGSTVINSLELPAELWFPQSSLEHRLELYGFTAAAGEQGVDLLKRCLKYEPSHRITAAEALRHPFLRDVYCPDYQSIEGLCLSLQQALHDHCL